jgi:hypothetical protein
MHRTPGNCYRSSPFQKNLVIGNLEFYFLTGNYRNSRTQIKTVNDSIFSSRVWQGNLKIRLSLFFKLAENEQFQIFGNYFLKVTLTKDRSIN